MRKLLASERRFLLRRRRATSLHGRRRVPIVTEATAPALVSLISSDRLAGWIGRLDAAVLEVFGREQSYRRQALTAVPDLVGRGAARYLGALTRNSARRRPLNRSKS